MLLGNYYGNGGGNYGGSYSSGGHGNNAGPDWWDN